MDQLTVTRRALLGALPVAAIPATALASRPSDFDIFTAWETWKQARRDLNALPVNLASPRIGDLHPEEQRLYDLMDAQEVVIQTTRASTPAGVAIQLYLSLAHEEDCWADDAVLNNADALLEPDRDRDQDWRVRLVVSALRSLKAMGA